MHSVTGLIWELRPPEMRDYFCGKLAGYAERDHASGEDHEGARQSVSADIRNSCS